MKIKILNKVLPWVGIGCLMSPVAMKAQGRPNLVFVFADQMRHDVLGYSGDKVAITPNLDKLSTQSVNFTNSVSVSPVCCPMRASLFTGKYTSSTGMVINELRLNPNHRAIGHVLGENGYQTAYIGKWHLYSNCSSHDETECAYIPPGPPRLGFDQVWKSYNFHHNNFNSYYFEDKPEKIFYGKGKYEPEEQFNMAMDFIGEAAQKKDKPFALFLSIGVPHDPWTKNNVPEKYYNMFKGSDFQLPKNWSDTPDKYMDRFTDPNLWLSNYKAGIPEMKHIYYAMITSFDEYMGRLIAKLEQLHLTQNTIIVVTSDHGEMFGEHGRIQKLIFYEAAARVPFLIRWDGKMKPGSKSDICLNTPDIMPTLLGLMKLPIPKEVEGQDLSNAVVGKKCKEPEMAFMQGMGHTFEWKDGYEWRAVRDKKFTYARYLVDGKELLFDNVHDKLQMHNLADNVKYAGVKTHMKAFMKAKMKDLNDEFKPCTWYQKNWVDDNRCIIRSARGAF